MKHYAQTLNLKDDPAIAQRYIEHHRAVWPEVERGLRGIGIVQMRIWLLGRRLFMLMETFQERVAEAKPGEWWAGMELVYELSRTDTERSAPTSD